MPRKNKVIHISNMPSEFRGTVTNDGRFIKSGIPPLGGVYDKVAKTTGLIRLGNEFLYNGVNNLIPRNNREKLMDNTVGRFIDYVKNFNKESFPNYEELGPTFPFNIIQTPRSNGKNMPQKQYAVGGKVPNVVNGGIAQPLGNNFFYMNGRKHSQGGIDIGPSDKTGIEVEDGEVVETNGNELKVYSAQPIINGVSPAKLVMGGANPNKVFKAQEDFKDRNRINDDGTKYKEGGKIYQAPSEYKRQLAKSNSIVIGGYPTIAGNRTYGFIKGLAKASKIGRAATNLIDAGRHKIYNFANRINNSWVNQGTKEVYRTTIGKHGSNLPRTVDYLTDRKQEKYGGKNMIVSISGNVKNGLLHTPSSTGGQRSKFKEGGTRIERNGRIWEYDEKFGAYVPITNRTINRTNAYPINKSARGETVSGSKYTFRNGRWHKNKSNVSNNNSNSNINSEVDNGNRRPQYYAERNLPLFNDGPAITSGLVRAGWSHGNKNTTIDGVNIPDVPNINYKKDTPRGEYNKSNQQVQSNTTSAPPIAVYNRNLPTIEASIPTTLPISVSIPVKQSGQSDGRGQGKFKDITAVDWIGLGSNIVGGLGSYFASKRAINKMKGPGKPTLISANKLKTKYNINPQLDRIREDKFEAYRDIDSNTASSRVGLARKQRVRNAAGKAVNQLYGEKENIETNLINQDRRNQQSVRQFNAQQYNQYIDRKAAFDNGIREAKVTNINNLFSGINAGIQDMISRYENRRALNNTIGAMRASAPNVDDRIMRDAGVDYDEFTIRKRRKLGGK